MPTQKKIRFVSEFNLSEYDEKPLAADKDLANFFEAVVKVSNSPKLSANWIMGELSTELNNENLSINESKITIQAINIENRKWNYLRKSKRNI